jgi:hypothetical protein
VIRRLIARLFSAPPKVCVLSPDLETRLGAVEEGVRRLEARQPTAENLLRALDRSRRRPFPAPVKE